MKNLQDMVENSCSKLKGMYPGLAIAVIDKDQQWFHFEGIENETTGKPIDEDTPFEIGSISKVFAGILLAKMACDGLVQLDQTCQTALPETVQLPVTEQHPITFRKLSNHTSGLARLPSNLDETISNEHRRTKITPPITFMNT